MLILKRIGFYILSFTWGIIMSTIGLIVMIIPFGKYHTFHGRLYKTVGKYWGGLELGCFFLCSETDETNYLRGHESGHGLQNIIWGPLMPFIITIPSAIRYWYRRLTPNKKHPPYDSIWFENQATRWGEKYIITNIL